MKKLYISAFAALLLSACGGTKDYDNYTAALAAQPAVIDTLSTPQSYGAYIDSLRALTSGFDALGIKLDETQQAEIATLGLKISEAMENKYRELVAGETGQTDKRPDDPDVDMKNQ